MPDNKLAVTSSDNKTPTGDPDLEIKVGPDAVVTLTPDPTDGDPKLWCDDEDVSSEHSIATGTWTLQGGAREGTFQAKWADGKVSNKVVVAVDPDPNKSPGSPETVAEVKPGVYDRGFAIAVLVLFLLGAALIAAFFFTSSSSSTVKPLAEKPDYEAQVLAVSTLFALAVGGLVLLAGAAMAALEVRGRLTKEPAPSPSVRAAGTAETIKEAFAGAANLMSEARTVRGTVLVILAGTAIVMASLFFVSCGSSSDDPSSDPTPSPSSSANPSGGPIPSVSPDSTSAQEPSPTTLTESP